MISKYPRPFVFIHIPKCAGTSIERTLLPFISGHSDFQTLSKAMQDELAVPGACEDRQHAKLCWFDERVHLSRYFVFAVVRNPFDRAISDIQYLVRAPQGRKLFAHATWKDAILTYARTNVSIWGHDLAATQVDHLREKSGQYRCDLVVHFESLAEGWIRVCKKLGLGQVPLLLEDNTAGRIQPYREFFDQESAVAIECSVELNISIATKNRLFGKAVRRIYPLLESLMEGFKQAVPSRSDCDAILVGVTDDKPADHFEEIDNTDAFFQVLAGCPYPVDDDELTKALFDRLLRAVQACPMTPENSMAALSFLENWQRSRFVR